MVDDSSLAAWQHRPVTSFAALHDLTGKVAVVTGGSRGIGRAIVQTLAEAGADVVIASRKLDACEAAADEVRASTGRRAEAIACHVGRWDDCEHLVAETLDRLGRLDVLVNNAGMSPLYESLDAVTEELYDKTLAVNLKGPFRLAVLAATHMAAHGGGSIVNIGTAGSLVASTNELPYACAKAGLNALTVGLAEAYAPTRAGQRHPAGPVPHRRHQGVARGGPRGVVRAARPARRPGGGGARWRCTSPARRRATRPAPSSASTAASPARSDLTRSLAVVDRTRGNGFRSGEVEAIGSTSGTPASSSGRRNHRLANRRRHATSDPRQWVPSGEPEATVPYAEPMASGSGPTEPIASPWTGADARDARDGGDDLAEAGERVGRGEVGEPDVEPLDAAGPQGGEVGGELVGRAHDGRVAHAPSRRSGGRPAR